ncbi:MAG TPA: hypothetical protein PLH65_01885, partial [bacterium]|nr:hypothetical protein [bacterium]
MGQLKRGILMGIMGLSGLLFLTGCYQIIDQPSSSQTYPTTNQQGYYYGQPAANQMYANQYYANQSQGYNGYYSNPNNLNNGASSGSQYSSGVQNNGSSGYYNQNYNNAYNNGSSGYGSYSANDYNNYSGGMGGAYDYYGTGGYSDYYGGSYGDQTYQDIYENRAATNQEINDATSQWLYDSEQNYINPETGELESHDYSEGSDWYQTSDGEQYQSDDSSYTPDYSS